MLAALALTTLVATTDLAPRATAPDPWMDPAAEVERALAGAAAGGPRAARATARAGSANGRAAWADGGSARAAARASRAASA